MGTLKSPCCLEEDFMGFVFLFFLSIILYAIIGMAWDLDEIPHFLFMWRK